MSEINLSRRRFFTKELPLFILTPIFALNPPPNENVPVQQVQNQPEIIKPPTLDELKASINGAIWGSTIGGLAGGTSGMLLTENGTTDTDDAIRIGLMIYGMVSGAAIGFLAGLLILELQKNQSKPSLNTSVQM